MSSRARQDIRSRMVYASRMANLSVVSAPDDPVDERETFDPRKAWDRNFYMAEVWSRDGKKIEKMLYGGNRIEKAYSAFNDAVTRRPRGRYTVRQQSRVLAKWPDA
jgi:hypothetical protein